VQEIATALPTLRNALKLMVPITITKFLLNVTYRQTRKKNYTHKSYFILRIYFTLLESRPNVAEVGHTTQKFDQARIKDGAQVLRRSAATNLPPPSIDAGTTRCQ
jgi:hypothetical protein